MWILMNTRLLRRRYKPASKQKNNRDPRNKLGFFFIPNGYFKKLVEIALLAVYKKILDVSNFYLTHKAP